jgi:hypothetical protein
VERHALLIRGVPLLALMAMKTTRISRTLLFWIAFVLTWPLGSSAVTSSANRLPPKVSADLPAPAARADSPRHAVSGTSMRYP